MNAAMLATLFGLAGAGQAAAYEAWWIRVRADGKTIQIRPDSTDRTEVATAAPGQAIPSLDGGAIVIVKDDAIHVADADGKNSRKVSPDGLVAGWPSLSPDGRRIAFVGQRDKRWQLFLMDRDGGNVRQLTDGPEEIERPRFGPDGRLLYLALHPRIMKLRPGDLLIWDGRETQAVVRNIYIADYAWSPDAKAVAYSKAGSLVFHDLATGAEQEVFFPEIDKRLSGHYASRLSWRPDGQALACTIMFLGGRRWGGPKIFGDDELFVIPRRGKPNWFQPGAKLEQAQIEWVNQPGAGQ
jgi:hypothetical protein